MVSILLSVSSDGVSPLPNSTSSDDTPRHAVNPPFGTKRAGIDMEFLEVASKVGFLDLISVLGFLGQTSLTSILSPHPVRTQVAKTSIYSLHKSSTRDYIEKKALALGFRGQVLAEMRYDLPK